MSQVPSGLAHFSRLSPAVWIHQPSTATRADEPDLVLLVGWMNASPKHVSKYTAGYEVLYPSSRILAITTTAADVFRSKAANLHRVKPILDVLYTLPPNAKFLLHFFSNGGAFTSILIAKEYRLRMGQSLPVTAVVLDSTPGRARIGATVRAFTVGLPRNILVRLLSGFILRTFFFLFMCWDKITRIPNITERIRQDLNDKTLFSADAPRTYIYSDADDMVYWKDVEDHGVQAESLGYRIEKDRFQGSGHCAHLMLDGKRYWSSVQTLWGKV